MTDYESQKLEALNKIVRTQEEIAAAAKQKNEILLKIYNELEILQSEIGEFSIDFGSDFKSCIAEARDNNGAKCSMLKVCKCD